MSPARAGDQAALERLREFLTPFLHGVALAHAPHHVVERLMPRLLGELPAVLAGSDVAAVGAQALATARRLAKLAGQAGLEEQAHPDAGLREGRQVLSRLRAVPEASREWLLLRLVEGIPGPELVEVSGAAEADGRAALERGASQAAQLLGQPKDYAGDSYLWELLGAPTPLLAQLEMQLPALRFDPLAAPAPVESHTAGTLQDLAPVGAPSRAGPRPPGPFDEPDETAVGAPPGDGPRRTELEQPVLLVPPLPAAPNPFEPVVRTVAATDLPAEARGQLPEPVAPIPSGSQGGLKGLKVPPRGDGSAASGTESSSKSGRNGPVLDPASANGRGLRVPPRGDGSAASGNEASGKSGRSGSGRKEGDAGSKSGRLAPLAGESSGRNRSPVALGEDGDDATRAQAPRPLQPKQEDVVTTPESHGASILGLPTSMMPAVVPRGTEAPSVTSQETRLHALPPPTRLEPLGAPPEPRLWSRQLFEGSSPWLVALALLIGAFVSNWAGIFSVEKKARSNWTLVQVVVAAEELPAGSLLTVDNVAVRAVPAMGEKSDVVKGDAMAFVLDQKLAVDVQMGDPLFYSQFVANRGNQRLSKRVAKLMRGYTIPTTALTSVAHNVKPGDVVDVLATFEMQGRERKLTKSGLPSRSSTRAVTILQAVSVLATGRIADFTPGAAVDENEKPYSHVTLLLTAEEAELITLARTVGPLALTLRNEDDKEQFAHDEYTDLNTLLDGDRRKVVNQRQRALVDQVKAIRSAPAPR